MNINEVRELLLFALEKQDPEAARTVIRYAVIEGQPIEELTDLHFTLMLLLSGPDKDTRGRPKEKGTPILHYFLNLACKVKAEIEGISFSKTWSAYCDKTRPKMRGDELWRCAGVLLTGLAENMREADIAVRTFQLSEADLKSMSVVKK